MRVLVQGLGRAGLLQSLEEQGLRKVDPSTQ